MSGNADAVAGFDVTAGARMLSVADAARALACSAITVRRLVRDGDLPAARIRRRLVIPTNALNSFARARLGE